MSIFSLLKGSKSKKDKSLDLSWMGVDMHSHLITGIDDGVSSMSDAVEMVVRLKDFGLKKIITTPHIMSEYYKNTPEIILNGLDRLKSNLEEQHIDIELEAAAEYYLDEIFMEKVTAAEKLLTISGQYVLVETGFLNKPQMLLESLFSLELNGYTPIFAHPERYLYLHNDDTLLRQLLERNILFQCNLLSFTGYYGKTVKKFAEKLVDAQQVMLVGTDAHNHKYLNALEGLSTEKYFQKLQKLPLLNSTL
ncbi:tyrosine-protein phosphatase [Anditalea andensis]|uniref:protein-tyrosine-phosphatase n=1 Tax=Anditalea andensis TaxID=1048983 RepID=A0A074LED6_9BACT|nr:CpsB/CapC family capsule biosynthesis tyrosine phosphatase [Anditalea andensis]KEO72122.1 capsular biosynthesis protein [Anditalea andensis]